MRKIELARILELEAGANRRVEWNRHWDGFRA